MAEFAGKSAHGRSGFGESLRITPFCGARRPDAPAIFGRPVTGAMLSLDFAWLKPLLLPPISLIVLAVVALVMPRRWRMPVQVVACVSLLLISVPIVPRAIALLVAETRPYQPRQPAMEQAIVVLGGSIVDRPEYGGPDVGPDSLHRLRLAARIHALTNLPVAITGGTPVPARRSTLADLMADVLTRDFRVPVAWRETRSTNTFQNAMLTADLLRPAGITRVVIITDAIHMPRAVWSFRRAGFDVTAAPIEIPDPMSFEFQDFVPRVDALVTSYGLAYELAGMLWYWAADRSRN